MELGLSQHWGYPVSMSNPEIHHIKNIACAGPNFRNTQFFVFELPQRFTIFSTPLGTARNCCRFRALLALTEL